MARTLTFRPSQETLTQLERRARGRQTPKTALVGRYVEEGLAMDAYPGIAFRDGPSGRRPVVLGGPDVWEVIQVFQAEGQDVKATAEYLGIRPGLVDAAAKYYASNTSAIDDRIAINEELMTTG